MESPQGEQAIFTVTREEMAPVAIRMEWQRLSPERVWPGEATGHLGVKLAAGSGQPHAKFAQLSGGSGVWGWAQSLSVLLA